MTLNITALWQACAEQPWRTALERYWALIRPENLALERALEALDPERVRRLDAPGWYAFLHDEYFRWKYTAPNRYATTTRSLHHYLATGALDELYRIHARLFAFDPEDIRAGLTIGCAIHGLGTAGASGLLALLYPHHFATVDQFVVKALRAVEGLPEAPALARMRPEHLSIADGVVLIGLMRRKAAVNNRLFATDFWTPRQIDKVLWTYGR